MHHFVNLTKKYSGFNVDTNVEKATLDDMSPILHTACNLQ